MTVYVIATNTEYTLGTDLTIAGQVWTEKAYGVPANVVTEDEIFDSEGYIQPQLIKNIFLNTSYVVANEAAMLALTTYTGNFVIRTDTSEVYIKLNNDNPADISDFALASGGSGVISVNGSTGVVSVTIASLLAVPANVTAFDAAVTISPTVAANVGAILTIQGDITTLQGDLADLDDYVQTHLGIQALSSAAQTPTGGDVGKSLIWNGTNYDLSLISGGGSGLADPMTTRGDLIYRNSSNVTARLSIGTATYVLTSDGTDVSWAAPSSSFTLVNGNGTTVNGTGDGVDLGGTLTGNVEIDGAYDVLFGNTTPLSSFNVNANSVSFNNFSASTSTYNNYFNLVNFGAEIAVGSEWGMAFRYDNAGLGTFNMLHGITDGVSAEGFQIDDNGSIKLRIPRTGSNWQLNLGSDATGDTYYRNSSGYFTRLAAGTDGHVLTLASGIPSWAAPSGSSSLASLSDVTLSTPLATQFLQYDGADWVNAYFSNPVITPTIVANAYTIQATDQNKILHIDNGSTNVTITLPNGLATNFSCTLVHKGTGGIITLVATTTLESYGTTIEIPEVGATVYHQGSNIWTALGALGAAGGGAISISGTPLANNVAIWVDADTVQGTGNLFTWDGATVGIQNSTEVDGDAALRLSRNRSTVHNTILTSIQHYANTLGTAAIGFGSKEVWSIENDTNLLKDAAIWSYYWQDPTNGAEDAHINLSGIIAGASHSWLTFGSASMNLIAPVNAYMNFNVNNGVITFLDTNNSKGYDFIPGSQQLLGIKSASGGSPFVISGAGGVSGSVTGENIQIGGGNGYGTGNNNGGHAFIYGGFKNGSGLDGNVALVTNSVANWQSMERGIFIGDALTNPTGNPTGGGFLFVEAGALKWRGSSGTITTIAAA